MGTKSTRASGVNNTTKKTPGKSFQGKEMAMKHDKIIGRGKIVFESNRGGLFLFPIRRTNSQMATGTPLSVFLR